VLGYGYLHTALDDHSRLAYTEILPDERTDTAAGFLARAHAWYYHRTLADEWAYARPYTSETQRRAALDPWLHTYNHHRGDTALNGQPPASRVTNLSGQNI
jgi:transposase InsO family protein